MFGDGCRHLSVLFLLLEFGGLFPEQVAQPNIIHILPSKSSDSNHWHTPVRIRRDTGSALGKCKHESLIYCKIQFSLQLNASVKTTIAQIALCKREYPTCPENLDISIPLNGCHYSQGCSSECLAFGEYCKDTDAPLGTIEYLNCCSGRIVNPSGEKIDVAGRCNEETRLCEPRFPPGTVCGDQKATYLACQPKSGYSDRGPACRYRATTRNEKNRADGLPHVSRSGYENTVTGRVYEQKRCFEGPDPCDSATPIDIYCGVNNLPERYNGYSFCDCPSSDLKTGYHCVGEKCKPCKLDGVSCSSGSDCCTYHECVRGKCVQCFPTGVFLSTIKCSNDGDYNRCCNRSDYCKTYNQNEHFCSKNPPLVSPGNAMLAAQPKI